MGWSISHLPGLLIESNGGTVDVDVDVDWEWWAVNYVVVSETTRVVS